MPTACATGGGNAFPIIRQAADTRVERELAALRERQVVEPLRGNPIRILQLVRPDQDDLVPRALHLPSTLRILAFSPAISPASSFVKAKHFLPRSFSDAPMR